MSTGIKYIRTVALSTKWVRLILRIRTAAGRIRTRRSRAVIAVCRGIARIGLAFFQSFITTAGSITALFTGIHNFAGVCIRTGLIGIFNPGVHARTPAVAGIAEPTMMISFKNSGSPNISRRRCSAAAGGRGTG